MLFEACFQLDFGLNFDLSTLMHESALSYSIVSLAVCSQWFSCWKVNLHLSLRSSAASNRFSSRIFLDLASSIFPSVLASFSVPDERKHPYRMMLPPCVTMGMVCSG
ncbi:hypothetical protein CHARACLAT_007087 [Characodon lateralis]|uniref:Uncharacterized protein n=1 Tax=Characodon lateralis TaxID=208331 RepID=A0ABU7DP21_9TELE|nr:hypothetical protein [Characodon lateralis]